MKRMTLLVAVLLALLLPLSVLADAAPPAAPEALDMTAPLEAAEYQFDFLPWFTTFDDALAAFGLEDGDYRLIIAGPVVPSEPGCRAVVEFEYPSALSGISASVQLIFEYMPTGADGTGENLLIGVRLIDSLADLEAFSAYMDAIGQRFEGIAGSNAVTRTTLNSIENWPYIVENFTANPLTASNFGLYNLKTFTDPVGLDRNANMYINLGASTTTRALQMGSGSGEYFALYEFVLDSIQD